MSAQDLRDVHEWLQRNPGTGLTANDVPGASGEELAQLASLGGLAGASLKRRLELAECDGIPDAEPGVLEAAIGRVAGHDRRIIDWLIGDGCPKPDIDIVDAVDRLLVDDPEDGLAKLYAVIVASRRRRRLGTFFTPKFEVDRMVASWQALDTSPRTVVDIGAGVGIYTMACAEAWPSSNVIAVDVNPVTLGLLILRLVVNQEPHTPVPRLERGDAGEEGGEQGSTQWGPSVQIVLDDYVGWVQREWASLPSPRLVIGNPPYTRMQLLPQELRAGLVEELSGLLGRRASLATLMTAVTVRQLSEDDGLCLLLPAQWLESDYASGLREWLWCATSRRVELRLFASDLFKDATVDTVSLLVGPNGDADVPIALVAGDTDESRRELSRDAPCPAEWRSLFVNAPGLDTPHRPGPEALVHQGDAHPHPAISQTTLSERLAQRATRPPAVLSDFVTVTRGVATGANWFFVLDEAERRRHNIAHTHVRPVVRRLRADGGVRERSVELSAELEAEVFGRQYPALRGAVGDATASALSSDAAELGWLLVTGRDPSDSALVEYLSMGERMGASAAVLCQRRPVWHDLQPELRAFDIAISPMSQDTFRLLPTGGTATMLNNLYGLRWHDHVDEETRLKILGFLRSAEGQLAMRRAARRQANNLLKVEPRALSGISVLLAD